MEDDPFPKMFCKRHVLALLVKNGVETRSLVTVTGRCLKGGQNDGEVVKYPSFEGRDEDNFPCLTRFICVFVCCWVSMQCCFRLQKKVGPVELRGAYGEELSGFSLLKSNAPFHFRHGGVVPNLEIAYETWGELNSSCSNAILLHTGLSATSHARSHEVCQVLCVAIFDAWFLGQQKSGVVGEFHWSWLCSRYREVFHHLLQHYRWLLWE